MGEASEAWALFWGILTAVIYGLVGVALAVIGFKAFDWATPRINLEEELTGKQNTAVAIVCGAVIIGICYIVAAAIN